MRNRWWVSFSAMAALASGVTADPWIGVTSATGSATAPPAPVPLLTPVVVGDLPTKYLPYEGYWTASISMSINTNKLDAVFRHVVTGAEVRAADVMSSFALDGYVTPAPGLTGQSSGTIQRVIDYATDPPTITERVKITLAITGTPLNSDAPNLFLTGPGGGDPIALVPKFGAIGAGNIYSARFLSVSTNLVIMNQQSGLFEIVPLSPTGGHFEALPFCPGDANGNQTVSFDDVLAALSNWNTDYTPGTGPGDADGSGQVGFGDILAVLSNLNANCN